MKLAVFGCSHTGAGTRKWNETWPYHLCKSTEISISNFAIGATSTQFQYDLFENSVNNFDKFIFQFTNPYRLTTYIRPIEQKKVKNYSFFPNHSKDAPIEFMTTMNLKTSTPGKYNEEFKNWIENDNGEILEHYKKICKVVNSHQKCLYAFHWIKDDDTNVQGIDVMQNNFPDIIRHSEHLNSEENQTIAMFIKERCKL